MKKKVSFSSDTKLYDNSTELPNKYNKFINECIDKKTFSLKDIESKLNCKKEIDYYIDETNILISRLEDIKKDNYLTNTQNLNISVNNTNEDLDPFWEQPYLNYQATLVNKKGFSISRYGFRDAWGKLYPENIPFLCKIRDILIKIKNK